ncbi:MAG: response regulator [Myxococcota bacterium]
MEGPRGRERRGRVREELDDGLPDVIVLDLMMPVMDGFEFLEVIRADSRHAELPVVVLPARSLNPRERSFLESYRHQVLREGRHSRDVLLTWICDLVSEAVRGA